MTNNQKKIADLIQLKKNMKLIISIFLTLGIIFIAWFLAGYLPAFIMALFNLK